VIYWDLKIGGEFVRGWWKQGGQLGFLSSDGRFVSILNYIKPGARKGATSNCTHWVLSS
jgi:hypothetical protein